MRMKKSGLIATIIITVLFLALGVGTIILRTTSPLQVSEDLVLTQSGNELTIRGKVKNESENAIEISMFYFTVTSSVGTYEEYFNPEVTLQPGEEYVINLTDNSFYGTARRMTEFSAVIDGTRQTVYESGVSSIVLSGIMFVFAGAFAIISVISIIALIKLKKRYDEATASLANMECHAEYFEGVYGGIGSKGKAAAQTAASALGGAISAFLFGFGSYKVYGANSNAFEFVITDDGMYFGKLNKGKVELANMNFVEKSEFKDAIIAVKKKSVIIRNDNKCDYYELFTKKNGTSAEQLAERLNGFKTAANEVPNMLGESAVAGGGSVEEAAVPEDPFAD